MRLTHISITEAKKRLGELVKRANYGGERFVLEFRDKPQAALVSYKELQRMADAEEPREVRLQRGLAALERLDALRARIAARPSVVPDSAEEVQRLRAEREDEIQGLR